MSITKKRLKKLAGLIKEDAVNWDGMGYVEPAGLGDLPQQEMPMPGQTKDLLKKYPAWLRAIHLWFHGAHHSVSGIAFAGDHAELYSRIYLDVENEVDGAVEKLVGLFDDVKMACPQCLTTNALEIMKNYESPAEIPSSEIPIVGLKMIKDYLTYLSFVAEQLERSGHLSMGLNDQMYSSANTHETYVYLLQQRRKL